MKIPFFDSSYRILPGLKRRLNRHYYITRPRYAITLHIVRERLKFNDYNDLVKIRTFLKIFRSYPEFITRLAANDCETRWLQRHILRVSVEDDLLSGPH